MTIDYITASLKITVINLHLNIYLTIYLTFVNILIHKID